jgi:ABC-type oligopeptide transport system substrate-binding subunit
VHSAADRRRPPTSCCRPGCPASATYTSIRPPRISPGQEASRVGRRGEPFDAALVGWGADYPDPAAFLNQLVYGPTIGPRDNVNFSYFDDPSYNRRLAAAARLSGPSRYLAYAALDADLARKAAPFVALANDSEHDFFSARVGCQVYQPVYGVDLAALCIRKQR